MSIEELTEMLQLAIATGLLLFVYFVMYRRTSCDRFREDIFAIRNNLFDYMWQNGISYDLAAYRLMRALLNGLIRTAPWVDFFSILLLRYATRHDPPRSELPAAIRAIDTPETKEYFQTVLKQVRRRILRYLYLEGIQWVVFRPIVRNSLSEPEPQEVNEQPTAPSEPALVSPRRREPSFVSVTLSDQMTSKLIDFGKPDSPEARDLATAARWRKVPLSRMLAHRSA